VAVASFRILGAAAAKKFSAVSLSLFFLPTTEIRSGLMAVHDKLSCSRGEGCSQAATTQIEQILF
jgi:hypothetical protein